jgi:hypothetical protein
MKYFNVELYLQYLYVFPFPFGLLHLMITERCSSQPKSSQMLYASGECQRSCVDSGRGRIPPPQAAQDGRVRYLPPAGAICADYIVWFTFVTLSPTSLMLLHLGTCTRAGSLFVLSSLLSILWLWVLCLVAVHGVWKHHSDRAAYCLPISSGYYQF